MDRSKLRRYKTRFMSFRPAEETWVQLDLLQRAWGESRSAVLMRCVQIAIDVLQSGELIRQLEKMERERPRRAAKRSD